MSRGKTIGDLIIGGQLTSHSHYIRQGAEITELTESVITNMHQRHCMENFLEAIEALIAAIDKVNPYVSVDLEEFTEYVFQRATDDLTRVRDTYPNETDATKQWEYVYTVKCVQMSIVSILSYID